MPSRLQIAKTDITGTFDSSAKHVYTKPEISTILRENQDFWRLAQSTTTEAFIRFLTQKSNLQTVELASEAYTSIHRYTWGSVSPYQLAMSLGRGSYLSHGTAAFLHGLGNQIPKTIYVNHEQTPKPRPSSLSQDAIHRAFSRKPRQSNYVFTHKDWRFVLTSGKHTGRLEVGTIHGPSQEDLDVTNLERTLIDIAVRPHYAGGVHQVLDMYKSARGRTSVNTLIATLKKLNYLYPYHQAIGFYMQRAGYEKERISRLHALGLKFDFYLTYEISQKAYDPYWKLYFPEGF